jgi:predicted PurR-regulated permease PerM
MFDNLKIHKIEISHKTIIFTILFLISLWLIYEIKAVILLFFIAFILMTALNPMVNKLQKFKLPRTLAIFLTFVLVIFIFSLVIAGIVPALIEQTGVLATSLIDQLGKTNWISNFDENTITSQIQTISSSLLNVVKIVIGAFSNIIALFSLLVLTFYLLVERPRFEKYLRVLFQNGKKERKYMALIEAIEKRLGGWVRGEIMLMLIVGTLTYIGLSLLHIPFALPLALLAGLLELIPNLGPTIAAVPAVIIGLTISFPMGIGVLILSIAVQQLENNIIVPLVMKKSIGLNPLVTLMCLMVGITIGGVGGAILAVPIFITIQTAVSQFLKD